MKRITVAFLLVFSMFSLASCTVNVKKKPQPKKQKIEQEVETFEVEKYFEISVDDFEI